MKIHYRGINLAVFTMDSKHVRPDLTTEEDDTAAPEATCRLMASMTRWEQLSRPQAVERFRHASLHLGLESSFASDPSLIENDAWRTSDAFSQALAELRGARHSSRMRALRGALEVAIGAGTLPLSQNLALRTVTEALDLNPDELLTLFRERTGSGLPLPWDPSTPLAWHGRPSNAPGPQGIWDDGGPHPPAPERTGEPGDRLARIKALALLGLDEGATQEEVRRAYLRVSKVHHPDQYLPHGQEATLEAAAAFRRIKSAYDFLMEGPS